MSTPLILETDWSDYDNRKVSDNRDARFFACTESWERDYLINKIKKHFPNLTLQQIVNAIEQCCKTIPAPHPRRTFVECVMQRLGL